MNTATRKTALITGATSGIGYELARLFAQDGHDLVIVSRSQEDLSRVALELSEAHGVHVTVLAKDLFQPAAARELYLDVQSRGLRVDFLVNDAGQGTYGQFVDTDLERDLDVIQLNVSSLVILTKLFARDMVQRGEGRILQLASMVSKNPAPWSAVYGGTKAFVYSFSVALAEELKDTGVTVTALRPGATDTDFFRKEGGEDARIVQEGKLAPPADVARDGYQALMSGEVSIVSGLQNKMMDAAGNLMGDKMRTKQMGKMHEPKHGGRHH